MQQCTMTQTVSVAILLRNQVRFPTLQRGKQNSVFALDSVQPYLQPLTRLYHKMFVPVQI